MTPHSQLLLPTEIKLQVILRYYGSLASKYCLAILHQLHVGTGVIDPDYTAGIMLLLIDTASHVHLIINGDLIAKLILEKVSIPILKDVSELPPTARGAQGYGFAIYIYMYILIHIIIYSQNILKDI